MADTKNTTFYQLEQGYTITKLDTRDCMFIFRDNNHEVVAVIEGCRQNLTYINPYKGRYLSFREKSILQRFIRSAHFQINTEVADILGLSIIHFYDGREEYLNKSEVQQQIADKLNCVSLYVSCLEINKLKIPSSSKCGSLNLSNAKIKKIVIEPNSSIHLDLRDNKNIESLRIGENFNGSVNLSRSTVESIILGDNCRCDLSISESKRCFNLIIADIYSGNLNVKDSCFYAIKIGYYCYAAISLVQNFGKRNIEIGDSFRGSLSLDDVSVDALNLGKDCRGKINIASHDIEHGSKEIRIDNDFGGILDLRNATGIERIDVGRYARGNINLLGNHGIKVARFDKYFNGYADFSNSSVEYVSADYGSSGDFVFNDCENLVLLELPRYKKSNIITEQKPIEISGDSRNLYYRYREKYLPYSYFSPFYKKVYHSLKEVFS